MIAIKDMEMPESCWDCPIINKENGQCEETKKYICGNDIPADCPLIEIITCENCKHWDRGSAPRVPDDREYHFCPMMECNTAEDFYCADGKRRNSK